MSGGQKRRVAIAGVVAMNPEILILDEPMAGLDPKGRAEILSNITEMHQKVRYYNLYLCPTLWRKLPTLQTEYLL